MDAALAWGVVVLAYLVGSVSFAVAVSRAFGLADPRTYGSQNPGATNVLRSGHKGAAALTLLLDALKGALPVWAVQTWGGAHGLGEFTVAAVGLAAFLGHVFPVFMRFKGGKGVATAAGVLLGVSPVLGGLTLLSWLAVVAVWRYSSLGAIVAAVVAPVVYIFGANLAWPLSVPMACAIVAMSGVLVARHRENLGRLLQGKEARLGRKAKP